MFFVSYLGDIACGYPGKVLKISEKWTNSYLKFMTFSAYYHLRNFGERVAILNVLLRVLTFSV